MKRPKRCRFEPDELSELDAVVSELVRVRAQVNALQARETQLIHGAAQIAGAVESRGEASSRAAELPHREVAAEVGAALRISDRTAQRLMGESNTLIQKFPATFAAFAAGVITRTHANVVADAGAHLPDAAARAAYEATVLPVAERESASRIRSFARIVAERLHPRSFTERHESAAAGRCVRVVDLPDGMAELIATSPAVAAHGVLDRLNRMARSVRDSRARTGAAGEVGVDGCIDADSIDRRSLAELRTDVFMDLLLTGDPAAHAGPAGLAAITAHMQVTVPVLSLIGRNDAPASLVGAGPIDAGTARLLAGTSSGWDRILTHPVSGEVVSVDRYTPGKKLKRTLQARDQHCRFPGCRVAVARCDIDHTLDFALGGRTCEPNLAHLCKRHHTLKHESAWRVVQKPGGILEWTSLTGRVYPDVPTTAVTFKPDDDWVEWFATATAAATATATATARC